MTRTTPAPARRKTKDATALTSLALRMLWAGWAIEKGRQPTTDDVKNNRGIMLAMAKNFLPELRRLQQTKGKTNEHKGQ
jgi:hypothetical protein